VVTLLDIEFADAEHARVRSYFTFYTATSTQPTVSVVGSYTDDVEQADGEWKIAKRVSTIG
jgi:3-phenylpropionate/cinnamic acid dioxygenase small subunit